MSEPTPDRPSGVRRKLRKATAGGIGVIALAIGLVTLFLLTQATGSGDFYERNYERLFTLNVVIASVLAIRSATGAGSSGEAMSCRRSGEAWFMIPPSSAR